LNDRQLRRAIVHEVIDWQVSDILDHAQRELTERKTANVHDVRRMPAIIQPSSELAEKKTGLESFLFDTVYRHPDVLDKRRRAQQALRETFAALAKQPSQLPAKFRRIAEREGVLRATADYLAGMTDHFAFEEHRRVTLS
jgi:dGTPase